MAAAPSAYRRLPGGGIGIASSVRLYQAPDHFLQISSTGFSENYKRFYFRDIQAVILERKRWQIWWFIALGCLMTLFAASASVSSGVGAILLWCAAAGFVLALLVNVFLGPCCACYIRTAVQTERIRSLTRVRRARAFVQRVAGLVEQHQREPSIQGAPMPAAEDAHAQTRTATSGTQ
jgi:hypothetical protein